ncbi:PKD domain-containing protein [Candidatus Pacearchaeota archaeon]|nr:PKD domain-containing protein [Candidatus Pacearchaeota archaeon]
MNKKVYLALVLSAFLITLAINFVSAQATSTCASGQEMLYLSSSTNAHGASVSSSGYTTKICYDGIFGTRFNGINAGTCTATNKIVRLSGTTNAHAEQIGQTTQGYSDVCYGNLQCTTRTLQSCPSDEKEVVRLYSQKNSHLAAGGSGVGPILVCCKILGNVTGAHWENLVGQEITQTSVGSTILMIVPGTDLDKTEINYTIEKKTTKWLFFSSWKSTSIISTKGIAEWRFDAEGTYRFTAEIAGSGNKQTSPELIVNNDGNNFPPAILITSLINGGIYFLDSTLNYSASVSDADDPQLSYRWDFGDGASSTRVSDVFRYKKPGQKTIIFRVTDSRGAYSEAKVDILVVNSSYIFSYISSPSYNQIISSLSVSFDASQLSYAVNVSNAPKAIKCLAGNCPNQTADGSVPVTNTPALLDTLNFSWKLSDNYKRSGMGSSGAVFNYQFSVPGKKSAELNTSISSSTSSYSYTNFTLALPSGVPYCSISGSSSNWVTSSGSTGSLNDCYKSGGQPTSACCPSGYSCDVSSKKCLPASNASASFCSDYKTKTNCDAFEQSVAEDSVKDASGGNVTCGSVIRQYTENRTTYKETAGNCRCKWTTGGTANECKSAYDIIKECTGGAGCVGGGGQPISVGSCQTTVSLSQDLCSTRRVKVYSISATWTGNGTAPATCRNGTIERSCIDFSQIKLPFFGSLQFIITITLIVLFYAYTLSRKNNVKKN